MGRDGFAPSGRGGGGDVWGSTNDDGSGDIEQRIKGRKGLGEGVVRNTEKNTTREDECI
jgi:hypothetical protein